MQFLLYVHAMVSDNTIHEKVYQVKNKHTIDDFDTF